MQVNKEQLDPCKVELKIELEPETVAKAIDHAYKDFGKVTSVPGLRKGKAPRAILEKFVDEGRVRQHAAEEMVGDAYHKAIEQEDIHPYADPEIDIDQYEDGKSFVFKAEVPLPPVVELGEYKGIEVKREVSPVTDEDVEAEVKYMQESQATSTKVEGRPVKDGDVVLAEVATKVEDEEKSQPRRSLVNVGQSVPGFDEHIIGMAEGEEKTFSIKYPEDFGDEKLAGKNVEFDVKVESIRERNLPELNDEFAKKAGNFESMDALREDVRKRMTLSAEESADRTVEHKIIEEILNRSKVCFPDVLVNHEVGHDIQDLQNRLSRQGITIEQYLTQMGKTQEEFINELKVSSAERVKTGLAMGEIVDKEKIDVTPEEVEAEIDRIAEESKTERANVEAFMEQRGGKAQLRNSMLNRKIADFLKSVSKIS
jgi:trigger factor